LPISREARSRIMAHIRGRDTGPELRVRRQLHARGLRYRVHDRRLPGSPDLVFPSRRVALFVHGCFWHSCPKCRARAKPIKINPGYWCRKLQGNLERDRHDQDSLRRAGWTVCVVWECETLDIQQLNSLADRIMGIPPVRARRSSVLPRS